MICSDYSHLQSAYSNQAGNFEHPITVWTIEGIVSTKLQQTEMDVDNFASNSPPELPGARACSSLCPTTCRWLCPTRNHKSNRREKMSSSSRPRTVYADLIPYRHSRPVTKSCISPHANFAVTASPDGGAPRAFYLTGSRRGQEFPLEKRDTNRGPFDISVGGGNIAETSEDHHCTHVWRLSDRRDVYVKRFHEESPVGAKLSRDGKTLVSCSPRMVFKNNLDTGVRLTAPLFHDTPVCRFEVNAQATRTFLLLINFRRHNNLFIRVLGPNLEMVTESDFDIQTEHALSRKYPGKISGYIPGMSSDSQGARLAIADDTSLRIWRPQLEIYNLPLYQSEPERPKYCAISSNGERVVATITGHNFGVWNCVTRTQIAVLCGSQGVGRYPRGGNFQTGSCAISEDGTIVVGGCTDGSVYVWPLWMI